MDQLFYPVHIGLAISNLTHVPPCWMLIFFLLEVEGLGNTLVKLHPDFLKPTQGDKYANLSLIFYGLFSKGLNKFQIILAFCAVLIGDKPHVGNIHPILFSDFHLISEPYEVIKMGFRHLR